MTEKSEDKEGVVVEKQEERPAKKRTTRTKKATAPRQEAREEKREMSTIEKVQVMSALAGVATDEDVKKVLLSKASGELVYNLFVEAVEKKLQEIMDGSQEKEIHMANILGATGRLDQTLQQFQALVVGFMETPLIEVLSLMNRNLGGKKFEFDQSKIASAPPAQIQQQQKPRQAPPPSARNVEYDNPPGPTRGGRTGGSW